MEQATTEESTVTYTVFTQSSQDHTIVRVVGQTDSYSAARTIARQHAAGIMFTDGFNRMVGSWS
jgi:hypothetical protein